MRSVLTHLLINETVSNLLTCGRKNQNYIHIDTYIIANQNLNHDDKSTLQCLTHIFCPQLIRNVRLVDVFNSSIIAHPANFDIPWERSLKIRC